MTLKGAVAKSVALTLDQAASTFPIDDLQTRTLSQDHEMDVALQTVDKQAVTLTNQVRRFKGKGSAANRYDGS